MLNNEKITPYFLTLVKGSKKEDTVTTVVSQHPMVVGAKLRREEKNSLEHELTLEELDNSVDKAKTKSARDLK